VSATPNLASIDIVVSGRYAYALTSANELKISDFSDPVHPKVMSTLPLPQSCSNRVRLQGRYVYVLDCYIGASVLAIVDVSNPRAPVLTGSAPLVGSFQGFDVSGRYAYIANNATEDALFIVGISDPKNPVTVSTTTDFFLSTVNVKGRYAYATNEYTGTLDVFDVRDVLHPVMVATTTLGFQPFDMDISGHYAYVSGYGPSSFAVVDIRDPRHPVTLKTMEIGGEVDFMAMDGRYAYLSDYTRNMLTVVDVSDPANPVKVQDIDVAPYPNKPFVSGRYVYVPAFENDTLTIIERDAVHRIQSVSRAQGDRHLSSAMSRRTRHGRR
jgi:hypothetical protein